MRKRKNGFSIVEILTVMSIIVILIGLIVPSLNKARRYSLEIVQKVQLKGIGTSLELFNAENQGYPPSSFSGGDSAYCGAMKLGEAMVGKDFKGYNPKSNFRGGDTEFYAEDITTATSPHKLNLDGRRSYMELSESSAVKVGDLYDDLSGAYDFDPCEVVLTDKYSHPSKTGNRGMPILYYKADTSGSIHPNPGENTNFDLTQANYIDSRNHYDYEDNDWFVDIDPFHDNLPTSPIDLTDRWNRASIFYKNTWDPDITINDGVPHNSSRFILLSAGYDGIFFTKDDIYNF
ncbi:MAG: type II secretion system protein [Candidatus Woesearchaeota archaeon]